MGYFTTSQLFLFPSFDLDQNEQDKLDVLLAVLEESGIGEIIERCTSHDDSGGGRNGYDPYRLFATIAYSFSRHYSSLRDIQDGCRYDLRYIYLAHQQTPSYVTISSFINEVIVPNRDLIFGLFVKAMIRHFDIDVSDVFIDGTKLEANANKYKFVFKSDKKRVKVSESARCLLSRLKLPEGIPPDRILTSSFLARQVSAFSSKMMENGVSLNPIISGKGHSLTQEQKDYRKLCDLLEKTLNYEEIEEICGPERNSFYKTDHDATAMCLKEDYYSGVGSNMHSAYNVQICVSKGLIMNYLVTQDRNDLYTFVPVLKKYMKLYDEYPKRVCADAGYGSKRNYSFLKDAGIMNYVKYTEWEGNTTGRRPSRYTISANGDFICLNGKKGNCLGEEYKNRHKVQAYEVKGCRQCQYRNYCKSRMKRKCDNRMMFYVDVESELFKQEAKRNLLSPKGIEMRVNRSAQVEGAFGVIKQDMGYDQFRRRGLEKVETEFMLVSLGYNIAKLLRLAAGKGKLDYWIAPENLVAEEFVEPRSKILGRKHKSKRSLNKEAQRLSKRKTKKRGG